MGERVFKIILIPFVFFLLLAVYNKLLGPLPISLTSTVTNKIDMFTSTGEGKATAVPDIAQISLGIVASASTIKEAQNQANNIMNKIASDLKRAGVESKDLETTSYYVNPNYDYSNGKQKITGYEVRINLEVKVRDFDKINTVIDQSTADGANLVGGLRFSVNDNKLKDLRKEARTKAITEAKTRAEELAQASGMRLGKIINIQEGLVSPYEPVYRTMMKAAGEATDVQNNTAVQPGEQDIRVNITLTYEIL